MLVRRNEMIALNLTPVLDTPLKPVALPDRFLFARIWSRSIVCE